MPQDKFSNKEEWVMAVSIPAILITTWFVLRPETFYHRLICVCLGVFLLACFNGFLYYLGRRDQIKA